MLRFIKILPLFFFFGAIAQEEIVQSVYFDFDKYTVDDAQLQETVKFVQSIDSTRIESVQIFGYTDDIGKEDYNYKLSTNRANTIKDKLINSGIKSKIIITIEGKGRILIDDDIVENLPEKRSKNRRVDIVMNLRPLPKLVLPGVYDGFKKDMVIGDRIMLGGDVLFEKGSSRLTSKAKNELDRLALLLHRYKNIEFEIQGHVCCTPPYWSEAIDKETKRRQLSVNRAERVYKYFIYRRIDRKRMTFKGYGNRKPLGKEPQYDRRVELVVTKV